MCVCMCMVVCTSMAMCVCMSVDASCVCMYRCADWHTLAHIHETTRCHLIFVNA